MTQILLILSLIGLVACSGDGVSSAIPSVLQAQDFAMTVGQNSRKSVDVSATGVTTVEISQQPSHGVVTVVDRVVTYRLTDPLYVGPDSFKYRVGNGSIVSGDGTVSVTVTAVTTGPYTFTENYTGGAYSLTGWKSHTSSFGHTVNSVTGFDTATYNGVSMPSRRFGIYGDAASYAGDASYSSKFSVLPVDGAGGAMKDWPWKAELIHKQECGADATVEAKLASNGGQYPLGAILLNYDIESGTSGTELTGYQVLFNGGGGSLTLSRFKNSHETATAYLDRWPNKTYGNEAMTNPIEGGPYKGWNYKNGVWPAGGNVGVGTQWFLAARYQYNSTTKVTTISYEARLVNGTDSSPGTWDHEIVLTGADSLPTGGSFGLMAVNYHADSTLITTDFEVVEYKLTCNLP